MTWYHPGKIGKTGGYLQNANGHRKGKAKRREKGWVFQTTKRINPFILRERKWGGIFIATDPKQIGNDTTRQEGGFKTLRKKSNRELSLGGKKNWGGGRSTRV